MNKTVCIKTLGCKVNTYESEYIISVFLRDGYTLVENNADIYVINTCTVTNESDKKSKKIIHSIRKNNPNSIVAVMGCYVQNLYNSNNLEIIIDYADIIIGNYGKSKILEYINEYIKTGNKIIKFCDMKNIQFEDMKIEETHNHTRGFIKIEDGCDNYCSYCVIPYVRGSVRSKNKDSILSEVNTLLNNGCKEIVLTGIHTGHYDNSGYKLFNLLLDLIEINSNYRIRISSIEIVEVTDEIISLLKDEKIASHMHIPLQSGCDKILKLMNRRYDTAYYEEKVKKIRKINPLISLSTDVIVGYPGETEEDFIETYNFCKKMGFSKIHVFPYSDRDGTVSSNSTLKVKEEMKKERVRKLLELSDILKTEYERNFDNKALSVLIENEKDGYFYGHTSNYLYLKLRGDYKINEFYNVKLLNKKEKNDIILL